MTRAEVTAKLISVLLPNRKQQVTDRPTGAPQDTHFHVHEEDTEHQPPSFSFHLSFTTKSGVRSSPIMEMQDLLQRLTEVSIRQQQIVEHLATRQSRTEEEIAAVRVREHSHLRGMGRRGMGTGTGTPSDWRSTTHIFLDAPSGCNQLLRGETGDFSAARPVSNMCRPAVSRLGIQNPGASPCPGSRAHLCCPTLAAGGRAYRRSGSGTGGHRSPPPRAVGMRNPATILELVEAIELADAVQHREAGDRVPPFPRRVVQERRAPEGTRRTVSRPAVPTPQDEPMPMAEPTTPPRTTRSRHPNGKPMKAVLDSGSAVTLIQSRLCPPHPGQKTLLPITCVHGDTRQVPARRVTISATPGAWPVEAGLVKDLPVAVLLGRDWPGFERLLAAVTPSQMEEEGAAASTCKPKNPVQTSLTASFANAIPYDKKSRRWLDTTRAITTHICIDMAPIHTVENEGFKALVKTLDARYVMASRTYFRQVELPSLYMSCRSEVKNELPYATKTVAISSPVRDGRSLRNDYRSVDELLNAAVCHLGAVNTIQRIRDRFHWPGLDADVKAFCQACPTCQIMAPRTPPPSPLIPLPIIEVPFERIGLDLVGPLPKSARGHEHILVIVDYATRYPEAVPLRKATAKAIAQELFLLASRVGIPAEILTDQGTPFMSGLMVDLCRLLWVKQLRTTVYHPQTDGLVERFNQTLKQMLRRVAAEDRQDWDLMIPYVMFGIREVPQASTGFTPFELPFGRQPRGLLDVAREAWEQQPAPHRTVVEHVKQMRERIDQIMPLVRENLSKAEQAQQRHYNRAAQPREFHPGDRVMVLVPNSNCKFLASWQGPYTVIQKMGPVTYRLRQPGRRQTEQIYHINLLKKWHGTRDQLAALSLTDPMVVDVNPQLSAAQKTELQHLVGQFQDVFSSRPGQTNVIQHDIRTPPGVIVRQRPYRVPESRRQAIEEKIQEMPKLGVIEPSRSLWSSPIVMVPKPDGTLRFCNDFRRLNEVSQFDSYPMPRVDELLDRLGRAQYITTLDLTKEYWQVPLTPAAREKTAFSTPSSHWQYRTLPFGLHGAPTTFQRMMDILLRPHQAYVAAYLDNVVVHSEAWEDHLDRLRRVLLELRRAGLTANPRKCHLAMSEAKYLGFQVGHGLICPQEKKVDTILTAPKPETKTQVRAFLGLAGYYHCFIPNFSSLAAPLTDLTRKGQPEKIRWTPAAEEALARIRTALTSAPMLRASDFSCPFLLQMDASDSGLGVVLSQVQEGEEHPILYISRKLSPAEKNYATVEREALAIRWAVLELRYYLLGRKFTLVTDHAPIQWMAQAKDTNARVTRWFLALQDFHFEVRHRAGADNTNADGRSWTAYAGPERRLLGGGGGGNVMRATGLISVALATNQLHLHVLITSDRPPLLPHYQPGFISHVLATNSLMT
ncbi:hypothetical protein M9458_052195 [Cirrhinus mrigala]|uniref:Gypsy retrotransposon integrase-like protein 1 n=1 Tax=Cirrhinus mrigala TaxID=683832 RepID=A0ABD0MUL6_CIRMR